MLWSSLSCQAWASEAARTLTAHLPARPTRLPPPCLTACLPADRKHGGLSIDGLKKAISSHWVGKPRGLLCTDCIALGVVLEGLLHKPAGAASDDPTNILSGCVSVCVCVGGACCCTGTPVAAPLQLPRLS